jgi:hypothetical protein
MPSPAQVKQAARPAGPGIFLRDAAEASVASARDLLKYTHASAGPSVARIVAAQRIRVSLLPRIAPHAAAIRGTRPARL